MYIGLADLTPLDVARLATPIGGTIAFLHEDTRTSTQGPCRFHRVDDHVWLDITSVALTEALERERSAHVTQRHDGWLLEFRGRVAFDDSPAGPAALVQRYGVGPTGRVARLSIRQVIRIELS